MKRADGQADPNEFPIIISSFHVLRVKEALEVNGLVSTVLR